MENLDALDSQTRKAWNFFPKRQRDRAKEDDFLHLRQRLQTLGKCAGCFAKVLLSLELLAISFSDFSVANRRVLFRFADVLADIFERAFVFIISKQGFDNLERIGRKAVFCRVLALRCGCGVIVHRCVGAELGEVAILQPFEQE